jgi:hypothetical protein
MMGLDCTISPVDWSWLLWEAMLQSKTNRDGQLLYFIQHAHINNKTQLILQLHLLSLLLIPLCHSRVNNHFAFGNCRCFMFHAMNHAQVLIPTSPGDENRFPTD